MILAIDFDDTLCDSKNLQTGYKMGPPTTGAVLATQKLKEEGHTIVIFTARNVQRPEVKKAVTDWCDYFHIPYAGVTNIKQDWFDLIIDNRAIHYGSWSQVMADIIKFQNQPDRHSSQDIPMFSDITKPFNEQ
jgi:hypothetical protein